MAGIGRLERLTALNLFVLWEDYGWSCRHRRRRGIGGRKVELRDQHVLEEGRVMLTASKQSMQVVFDQLRADRRAGVRTGALVSGYPGSPAAAVVFA